MAGRRSAAALRVVEEEQRRETSYADPGDVADFVANLKESFLYCREMGHNWRPFSAGRFKDGGYERILRCSRCKTERHQAISPNGVVIQNKYVHPDGYLSHGLGRIVGEGRGVLRLESIKRIVSKGD